MAGTKSSGRIAQPTALKLLRGNPGRRPLPKDEPRPAVRLPNPPAHFTAAQRAHWFKVGRQLKALGVMTEVDGNMLGLLCEAMARWDEAVVAVQKYGMVIIHSKTQMPVRSPYLDILTESTAQTMRLLQEFGMGPSSRARVTAQPKPTKADPMEEMLGG